MTGTAAYLIARGLPATAHALTRTVRLTSKGRSLVAALKRLAALKRAEQAACGDVYSPATVTHPAESSA